VPWPCSFSLQAPAPSRRDCPPGRLQFKYKCTRSTCGREIGRHSASIDVQRHLCGACHGTLVALGQFTKDGTPARARGPTAYSAFVKASFPAARAAMPPGTPSREVLRSLSATWSARKLQQQQQGAGGGGASGACVSGAAAGALRQPAFTVCAEGEEEEGAL
jgi:hypothetical protein